MKPNRHEYRDMEALALSMGVKWRLDAAICPCLPNADSGGLPNRCTTAETSPRMLSPQAPVDLRVDPGEAIACEMSSEDRVRSFYQAYDRLKDRPASGRLYTCGAGLTGFHVDPYGRLQPCLMTPGYGESLERSDFATAWKNIGRIREVDAPPRFPCNDCDKQPICSGCPALFDLENGAPGRVSEYVCTLAQKRYSSVRGREDAHEAG